MTWLVTGGAGYIGAHVVRALRATALPAVVVDDLSSGRADVVPAGVALHQFSVLDTDRLTQLMTSQDVQGVIHLAAKKAPAESVADPLFYYRENVGGMMSVLDAMRRAQVSNVVLSSSCSVYGSTDADLVTEDAPYHPESPYGETKAISEWLVMAAAVAYNVSYVNLRYFNVAGTAAPELADRGHANLIPMAFRALDNGEQPQVFGVDYDTSDGSCIRDFVHVADLADAHVAAAKRLEQAPMRSVYNVGTGRGNSVFETLAEIATVTGLEIKPQHAPRRPGDPVRVVGDVSRIARELGWQARYDLHDMVLSAWRARGAITS